MVPDDLAAISDQRDRQDMADPVDSAEPTDRTDPIEPMLSIEATEPILPIDSTDPREAIEHSESVDHRDSREELAEVTTPSSTKAAAARSGTRRLDIRVRRCVCVAAIAVNAARVFAIEDAGRSLTAVSRVTRRFLSTRLQDFEQAGGAHATTDAHCYHYVFGATTTALDQGVSDEACP